MSKLEELIEQYCPDGVEWKPLAECCNILDGKRKPITKGARQSGPYPYYGANGIQDWVADYIFDGTYVLIGEDGSVITPNGTPIVNWAHGKIWVNNHAHIIAETTGVLLRFLFYYIQIIDIHNLVHGNIPKLTQGDLKEIEIPVPPLPVQEEIVRILDAFTELQAELQKRKQQYNYYLDNLLNFKNINRGGYQAEVRWMKMSEVFEIRNGYTPSKAKKEFWEGGTIPWFRMEDIRQNGRILSDSILHITPKGVKGKGLFKANSFILATTATIGEHALIIADSLANQRFTNLSIRKSLENELSVKYVYYYFFVIDEWCKANTNVSNFASVDMSKFYNLLIPIPSIAEQQRIVAILDRFDTLTTDLTQGLPAEIEKRRQQYEYYRDKLLTFKRKGA